MSCPLVVVVVLLKKVFGSGWRRQGTWKEISESLYEHPNWPRIHRALNAKRHFSFNRMSFLRPDFESAIGNCQFDNAWDWPSSFPPKIVFFTVFTPTKCCAVVGLSLVFFWKQDERVLARFWRKINELYFVKPTQKKKQVRIVFKNVHTQNPPSIFTIKTIHLSPRRLKPKKQFHYSNKKITNPLSIDRIYNLFGQHKTLCSLQTLTWREVVAYKCALATFWDKVLKRAMRFFQAQNGQQKLGSSV